MDERYNSKRIKPPIWQHDYHVLTRLYKALKILIRENLKKDSHTVLDYGSGTSPYKELFNFYASRYIRVDIDKTINADYVVGENEKIPIKSSSVDIVVSTQVLEHIQLPDFYLSECSRLLRRNGLLFLSTHGLWPYHAYPDDYRRWTKTGLNEEIRRFGFEVEESVSILGPFASVIQYEMLLMAEKLIKRGLAGKLLLLCFSLMGNVLIWLEDKIVPPTRVSDASLYIICAKKI